MSKEFQCLEQKDPTKNCKTGKCTAIYNAITREFRIRLHLLRHRKAGNGTGRGKHGDKSHQFDIAESECNRKRKHDCRYDDKTGGNGEHKLTQMRLIAPAMK